MSTEDLEPKDKRTKEYKEWKARQEKKAEAFNLGDHVEKITEATGIKAVVDKIAEKTGKDCGCNTRKEQWNDFGQKIRKKFIHVQPELLTEEEFTFLVDYFNVNRTRVSYQDQLDVYKVYNRAFREKVTPTSCPSCYKRVVGKLHRLIEFQRA